MNMQAMLKQAQALQKDMLKIKDEIDKTEFVGESSFVKVTVMGDNLDKDDIEALQDMIIVAINEANNKIDKETEKKMGKFGNIPGLF